VYINIPARLKSTIFLKKFDKFAFEPIITPQIALIRALTRKKREKASLGYFLHTDIFKIGNLEGVIFRTDTLLFTTEFTVYNYGL